MHERFSERAVLRRKLEEGVNIHMPAPRRIGKTWTIARLAGDLRKDGWVTVELDVEGMRTTTAFARALCQKIEAQSSIGERAKSHILQRITNALGGGWGDKPLDALGRVDPIEFADTLVASLGANSDRAVIFIDEVAYFFLALAEDDPTAARDFAYRLRAIQREHPKVRWFLTGSIGLDTIARRYGLEGAFVDFETFTLEPFTREEARSFIRDRNVQRQFNHMFAASDGDLDAMFERLGWLAPYYLKMVANEVRPSIGGAGGQDPTATRGDFEAALEKLLRPNRKSEFAVWREHIQKNLPTPDRLIAERLLAALSQTPDGETRDTLVAEAAKVQAGVRVSQVREILDMLSNDGLVVLKAGRYAFRSGLVRDYWREYEA